VRQRDIRVPPFLAQPASVFWVHDENDRRSCSSAFHLFRPASSDRAVPGLRSPQYLKRIAEVVACVRSSSGTRRRGERDAIRMNMCRAIRALGFPIWLNRGLQIRFCLPDMESAGREGACSPALACRDTDGLDFLGPIRRCPFSGAHVDP